MENEIKLIVAKLLGHYPSSATENWLVYVAQANVTLILNFSHDENRAERAVVEVTRLIDIHQAGIKVELITLPIQA